MKKLKKGGYRASMKQGVFYLFFSMYVLSISRMFRKCNVTVLAWMLRGSTIALWNRILLQTTHVPKKIRSDLIGCRTPNHFSSSDTVYLTQKWKDFQCSHRNSHMASGHSGHFMNEVLNMSHSSDTLKGLKTQINILVREEDRISKTIGWRLTCQISANIHCNLRRISNTSKCTCVCLIIRLHMALLSLITKQSAFLAFMILQRLTWSQETTLITITNTTTIIKLWLVLQTLRVNIHKIHQEKYELILALAVYFKRKNA